MERIEWTRYLGSAHRTMATFLLVGLEPGVIPVGAGAGVGVETEVFVGKGNEVALVLLLPFPPSPPPSPCPPPPMELCLKEIIPLEQIVAVRPEG